MISRHSWQLSRDIVGHLGSEYRRACLYPWTFRAESKTGSDASSWTQTSCWLWARLPLSADPVRGKRPVREVAEGGVSGIQDATKGIREG